MSNVTSIDGVAAGDCSLEAGCIAFLFQCRGKMIGSKLPLQRGAGQSIRYPRTFSGIGGIQSYRKHDVAIG